MANEIRVEKCFYDLNEYMFKFSCFFELLPRIERSS